MTCGDILKQKQHKYNKMCVLFQLFNSVLNFSKTPLLGIWFYFPQPKVKCFPSDPPWKPLRVRAPPCISAVPLGPRDTFTASSPGRPCVTDSRLSQPPGQTEPHLSKNSVEAAHLHGPASTNCHWGFYPDDVWSLHRTSRWTNTQPNHLSHAEGNW